ncbi:MAG: hypothetical protein LW806_04340 [Planctomycetaceae bacterium]|nr:hypothetical protein [Planctomycetaceae bacterium]
MTGAPGGSPGGFPGGFRVFTVGRDTASRFRVRPPWRARANAGPLERAVVAILTFILALPVAVLLLALGLVLLAAFLGCAAIFVALGIALWIVRSVFGLGGARPVHSGVRIRRVDDAPSDGASSGGGDGRENVRVLPRQDPDR